jgi:hypothetical protein
MLIVLVAAGLRFWQLGDLPPGLYRDEAYNGLDALDVLSGERKAENAFYFTANNGREPAYIYLTAAAIHYFGQTPLAVRLTAAVTGTLTTWITYQLVAAWFGRRTGLLAAWSWAVTVWPIHLSRIGLRAILLPGMLALAFWIGTAAYRRQQAGRGTRWLWLMSGLTYGLTFYTYLAARFTPLFVLLLIIFLTWRGYGRKLWPGLGWVMLGTAVALIPWLVLFWQQPDLILGRSGQVSVFNPDINQGSLWATLGRHISQSLGLFFIKGDEIMRHNPPGRPVFDLLLAVPFIAGVVWSLGHWHRPPVMAILLWTAAMLGPTILAEDAPHFLRAAGILPAALVFLALGLSQLWTWTKLPSRLGPLLVLVLLAGSLAITINDYFVVYGRQPETGYWFEAAARDLAENVNDEPGGTAVLADQAFWDGWPSVRFLLDPDQLVHFYDRQAAELPAAVWPAAVYAWPYEKLDLVAGAIAPPAFVRGQPGSLAQGDLEPEPYPLYSYYSVNEWLDWPALASFDNTIELHQAIATVLDQQRLEVDLTWSTNRQLNQSLIAFVHVTGPVGLIGQSDSVPSQGYWPVAWWRPGLMIRDVHQIELTEAYQPGQHPILIGLYDASTRLRLPVFDRSGNSVGDTWLLEP